MGCKKSGLSVLFVMLLCLCTGFALLLAAYNSGAYPVLNDTVDTLFVRLFAPGHPENAAGQTGTSPSVLLPEVASAEWQFDGAAEFPVDREDAGGLHTAAVPGVSPGEPEAAAAVSLDVSGNGYTVTVVFAGDSGWSYTGAFPVAAAPCVFADAVAFIDAEPAFVLLSLADGQPLCRIISPVYPAEKALASGMSYVFAGRGGGVYAFSARSTTEDFAVFDDSPESPEIVIDAPPPEDSALPQYQAPETADVSGGPEEPQSAANPEIAETPENVNENEPGDNSGNQNGSAVSEEPERFAYRRTTLPVLTPDAAESVAVRVRFWLPELAAYEPDEPYIPGNIFRPVPLDLDSVPRIIAFCVPEQGTYTAGIAAGNGAFISARAFTAVFTQSGEMPAVSLDYVSDKPQVTLQLSGTEVYYAVCGKFPEEQRTQDWYFIVRKAAK